MGHLDPSGTIWGDRLGRWSTRSLQVLLIIAITSTAGTIVAGIIGAVLAVPVAAVVWAIIRVWQGPDTSLDERPPRRRGRGKRADAASHDELPPASAGGTPVAQGIAERGCCGFMRSP